MIIQIPRSFIVGTSIVLGFAQNVESQALPQSIIKVKPNFIIIMADDMGYGDISCYGNKQI
jgi:hypothetical protein